MRDVRRSFLAGCFLAGLAALNTADSFGANPPPVGAVFVGTNHNNTLDSTQPPNQIAMYNRAADGRLSLVGYFNTGGQGSGPSIRFAGDGLGSSHSIR